MEKVFDREELVGRQAGVRHVDRARHSLVFLCSLPVARGEINLSAPPGPRRLYLARRPLVSGDPEDLGGPTSRATGAPPASPMSTPDGPRRHHGKAQVPQHKDAVTDVPLEVSVLALLGSDVVT